MAGTFSRREKRTDADTSTSMDVNGTEALSVSTTMLPVWEDALSLLLLARLILPSGAHSGEGLCEGRIEVSFQARLGGFGSDTPISCDRLSGVHRMHNYSA